MTQGADEQIYGLIAIAEDQQAAVQAAIEGLALERAALAKDRVTLLQGAERLHKSSEELIKSVLAAMPQIIEAVGTGARQAIQASLVDIGADATRAVTAAAQPTIDQVHQTVKAATTVQRQLGAAVQSFGRDWKRMVALAIVAGVAIAALFAGAAVWWQVREIEQLTAQRDALTAEIASLQGQSDQARRNGSKRPPKAP